MNKITNNKFGKGLVSLLTIIMLMISMLTITLTYDAYLTGNAVKELSIDGKAVSITEVNDINELNQLNEGWYEIRSGHVFYLESFDSYVNLYIRVNSPQHQNGVFVVDADGNIIIKKINNEIVDFFSDVEEKSVATTITGRVTGMEGVSG